MFASGYCGIFLAILNYGNLSRVNVCQTAFNKVHNLDIVIRHAVTDEYDPFGLPHYVLGLIPDLSEMRVSVVLQM